MAKPEEDGLVVHVDRMTQAVLAVNSTAGQLRTDLDAVEHKRHRDLRIYVILAVIVLLFGVWTTVVQVQVRQQGRQDSQLLQQLSSLVHRQSDCSSVTGKCFSRTLSELNILFECANDYPSSNSQYESCVTTRLKALGN
jgi:hypothetical protein